MTLIKLCTRVMCANNSISINVILGVIPLKNFVLKIAVFYEFRQYELLY